jgi:L,D-transpeptidase ErfK/SrfK
MDVVLRDGQGLHVRPICPDDKERLEALLKPAFRAMAQRILLALFIIPFLMGSASAGGAYPYEGEEQVIGALGRYRINGEETLHEVARHFALGYNEIVDANPGVDPWLPGKGTEVLLPSRWILPEGAGGGIVINLAEMRLYYYMKIRDKMFVRTYAVGIGREGFDTPVGKYRIIGKKKDPSWTVPPSIREEDPDLPAVIGPGKDNPLGSYAMRLSDPVYLIHGTNEPFGVGRKVSHGCIRLYPEDIEELYASVKRKTEVSILYQPIKIGRKGETVYIEVHRDFRGSIKDLLKEAVSMLMKRGLIEKIDTRLLWKAVREQKGVPTVISSG